MRQLEDKTTSWIARLLCLFSISLLIFMAGFIIHESLPAIKEAGILSLLSGGRWQPLNTASPQYSIKNMLLSTLYVSALAVIFALVLGVGCAVFLAIALEEKQRMFLLPVIELLAGIPSVIYGFIGLQVVVRTFEKLGRPAGESVLAGAIVLGCMLLPFIISSCCETMVKIKEKHLLASHALGISNWYMAAKLILPASVKGILISLVLAVGRAMGETMAVMMVMGNATSIPTLLGKGETLSSLIALEMGAAEVGSIHFSALYFSGLVLLFLLLLINVTFFLLDKFLLEDKLS